MWFLTALPNQWQNGTLLFLRVIEVTGSKVDFVVFLGGEMPSVCLIVKVY